MSKRNSVRKYTVSALLATSVAISPVMAGSVFAHGAPDVDVSSDESTGTGVAVLSQGEQSQEVKDLQQKLQNLGYDVNPDGIYGPETEKKIIDFQYDQGWDADGVVDTPTLNALNAQTLANKDDSNQIKIAESSQPQVMSHNISASSTNSNDTISIAESMIGTPYVWGGTDPNVGLDSSGFINAVFAEQDIQLSRTHAEMWANDGVEVANPEPGDVVFFSGTYEGQDGISHSGIYIGNHQMIHAGTEETGVEITTPEQWQYYWANHYVGAKRF
ncbi:NlpC/P60 family protein [Virgibacillus halophilus]|uniref:C40 family peptidase n=1 Tax=Tigheibacillus halophilus TaxID=361280 RepID=UPI00363F8B88